MLAFLIVSVIDLRHRRRARGLYARLAALQFDQARDLAAERAPEEERDTMVG